MIIELTLKRDDGTILLKDRIDAFEVYEAPITIPIEEDDSKLYGFTYLPLISGKREVKCYNITYSSAN